MTTLRLATGFLLLFCAAAMAQPFTKISDQIVSNDGGDSRSVNWVDIDGDGDLDLFVTNGHSPGTNNFAYENLGNGVFDKITNSAIVQDSARSDGASWGDVDNDGDPDVFVANWYNDQNLFYINEGDWQFRRIEKGPPGGSMGFSESCSWADANNDGWLDLFIANSGNRQPERNAFYLATDGTSFTKIFDSPLSADAAASRSPNWADVDGDGDADMFVANEGDSPNHFFKNLLKENGKLAFEKITDGAIAKDAENSISGSWADVDNDGDFDLFVANLGQPNVLYLNDGRGNFQRQNAFSDSSRSFGSSWGDIDNDGDLDLFVANGWAKTGLNNHLFRNLLAETGTATFEEISGDPVVQDGGWSYGSSFADYDSDGDLDLFVAKWLNSKDENNALFRNDLANENNWLIVNCVGTTSNRSAIGATVRVKAKINGKSVWQMRQISGQDSYCGQNLQLHFGLGNAQSVDSLIVNWPSGVTQTVAISAINRSTTISEHR